MIVRQDDYEYDKGFFGDDDNDDENFSDDDGDCDDDDDGGKAEPSGANRVNPEPSRSQAGAKPEPDDLNKRQAGAQPRPKKPQIAQIDKITTIKNTQNDPKSTF